MKYNFLIHASAKRTRMSWYSFNPEGSAGKKEKIERWNEKGERRCEGGKREEEIKLKMKGKVGRVDLNYCTFCVFTSFFSLVFPCIRF